jgi:hypothetical protein
MKPIPWSRNSLGFNDALSFDTKSLLTEASSSRWSRKGRRLVSVAFLRVSTVFLPVHTLDKLTGSSWIAGMNFDVPLDFAACSHNCSAFFKVVTLKNEAWPSTLIGEIEGRVRLQKPQESGSLRAAAWDRFLLWFRQTPSEVGTTGAFEEVEMDRQQRKPSCRFLVTWLPASFLLHGFRLTVAY